MSRFAPTILFPGSIITQADGATIYNGSSSDIVKSEYGYRSMSIRVDGSNSFSQMMWFRNPTEAECAQIYPSKSSLQFKLTLPNPNTNHITVAIPGSVMMLYGNGVDRGFGRGPLPATCCSSPSSSLGLYCQTSAGDVGFAVWVIVDNEVSVPQYKTMPTNEWGLPEGSEIDGVQWSCAAKTLTGEPADTGVGGCFYKAQGEDCHDVQGPRVGGYACVSVVE